MTDKDTPDDRVRWWERLGAELAAGFLTLDGFRAYLRRHRLEVSQQLTIIRRSGP